MAGKARRKKSAKSRNIKDALIIYAIAVVFLALGIYGIVSGNASFREYQNSTDVRTVESTAVYVQSESETIEHDTYTEERVTWYATLEYEIDGVTYSDKEKFETEVNIGDTKTIEVYRTSKGDYKIPEVTNVIQLTLMKILYWGSIILGLLLAVIQTVLLFEREKNVKKKE